jgi:hypothetical protein
MEKTAAMTLTSAPSHGSTHRWNQAPEHPNRHIVRTRMKNKEMQPVTAAVIDIAPHDFTLRFRVTASKIASAVDAPNKANATVAAPQNTGHELNTRRRTCDIVSSSCWGHSLNSNSLQWLPSNNKKRLNRCWDAKLSSVVKVLMVDDR